MGIYPRTRTKEDGLAHTLTSDQKSGCWNVYGTTGTDYATKSAPQMAAVKKIVDHALDGRSFDILPTSVGSLDMVDVLNQFGISQSWFTQSVGSSAAMHIHDHAALPALALI